MPNRNFTEKSLSELMLSEIKNGHRGPYTLECSAEECMDVMRALKDYSLQTPKTTIKFGPVTIEYSIRKEEKDIVATYIFFGKLLKIKYVDAV